MASKRHVQKCKDMAFVVSILSYISITAALYFAFLGIGIESIKALIEAIVISATLVTLVVLYLFGRIWKMELCK
ncbi:MAG: hypothetical protein DRO99_02020 [Candidatus Aenigmatarchaeota archaeon]|nr:MAG: hypothetical protein DRO99_02020 [Candidatus Aenigmarchaeota archaeon]